MKLRIVSDGTSDGTQVLDEHGNRIELVERVAWEVTASKTARAVITVAGIAVDVVGETPDEP